MSEENQEENVLDTTSLPPGVSPKSVEVLTQVSEAIKASGPQVRERLVANLVEKELAERVGLLDRGLQKRSDAERELRKCNKPDREVFDAEGKVISAGFSKEAREAIKKAKEALSKIDLALEKALGGNDFGKLKELCK